MAGTISAGAVSIGVKPDTTGFGEHLAKGLEGAREGVKRIGEEFGKDIGVGLASGGLVVAIAAAGAASIHLAGDYQEATTKLVTGAGESKKNLDLVSQGLLDMAPKVGMGPKALADAMFLVESAGNHGAAGLKVMQAAAEGAKIGGADATVVANGLTTAMTDYNIPASKAAETTSKLIATVAAGKSNMSDLAGAMSTVAPAAAAAHVSLDQVLGGMATMTGEGVSAQQAAQNLTSTIASMGNPTAVQTKAMAQMGLSSIDVAKNLGKNGLTGTMQTLSEAVLKHMGPSGLVLQSAFNESKLAAQSAQEMLTKLPPSLQGLGKEFLNNQISAKDWSKALRGQDAMTANLGKQFATTAKSANGFSDQLKSGGGDAATFNATMSAMTGGQSGLQTALALTGTHAATFNDNVKNISKSTTEAGGHVHGWQTTQEDFNTKMSNAGAAVEAAGVKIGTKFLPYVTDAAGFVGEKLVPALLDMGKWVKDNGTWLGILGGSVLVAVGALKAYEAVSKTVKTVQAAWTDAKAIARHGQALLDDGVSAVRNGAQQVAAAARGTAAWVASKAKIVAGAVEAGAAWVASSVKAAAGAVVNAAKATAAWLASKAKIVAGAVATGAETAAAWAVGNAKIVAQATVAAAKTTAAWIASNAKVVAGAVVSAGETAAAWVVGNAKIIASLALTAGAWALQNAQMLIAKGIVLGSTVWIGIATAAQWAWNLAMDANPIGLIILAVVGLVAAIIWIATQTTIFQDTWKASVAAIGAIWNWLWTVVISPVVNWIVAAWGRLGATIAAVWASYIQPALNAVGAAFSWVWNNVISPVAAFISNAIHTVGDAVHNVFSGIGDFIGGAFQKAVGLVKGPVNTIIGFINQAIDGANAVGGAFGVHIGHIPMLAKGGTITGAGQVIVGERGPELLTLPRGATVDPNIRNAAGSGGAARPVEITQNIEVKDEDPRVVARKFGRELVTAMSGTATA